MRRVFYIIILAILSSCGHLNNDDQTTETSQFIWDFSKPQNLIYSYSQSSKTENKLTKDDPNIKMNRTVIGDLIIKVKENNLADLSITNLEIKNFDFDGKGNATDSIVDKAPPMVFQNMKPNGKFDDVDTDMFFKLLFPLPTNDLSIGGKEKIEIKFDFRTNDTILWIKGFNTLEFSGFKKISGRKYAMLSGIIDISDMKVPTEFVGEYKAATKGSAIYYFDLKNGVYVGCDFKMNMTALIDEESINQDHTNYWEMNSEDQFKIRLKKIEK